MQTIKDLTILNDYMENQNVLAKLPDRFISRWNREATREMKEQKRYPDFKTFTASINAEADLAPNPISSCNAVAYVAGVKRGRGRGNLGARVPLLARARSRALIPFPFPFERLPRRLVTQ